MADYQESILEYIQASEVVLEEDELTDYEQDTVQALLNRLLKCFD